MLDDFTPIIHHLEGRTIRAYCVGDVHLGACECDLPAFKSFLKKIEGEPDSYTVIAGDLLNNCTRSSVSNIWDETMSPAMAADYAAELLTPVSDRILCAVRGNHENRSVKETSLNPLYIVMASIGRGDVFRPNMGFVRVILGKGSTKDHYAIMVTHGKSFNKKKAFIPVIEGVDACVFAHTHQGDIMRPAHIRFGQNNRISVKDVVSVTCSPFLKAGGYSLANLYPPHATSLPQCLELEYAGTNTRKGHIKVVW